MEQKVRAVYRAGAFILQEPCNLPEGAEVELIIQEPLVLPPEVSDSVEQARILKMVAERMQHNLIPTGASRLTREELHERC